jgi:hypothetical protein
MMMMPYSSQLYVQPIAPSFNHYMACIYLTYIITFMSDYRRILNWQLDLVKSYRSVTTSNYKRFNNSHILHFTRAHN